MPETGSLMEHNFKMNKNGDSASSAWCQKGAFSLSRNFHFKSTGLCEVEGQLQII
jgi:hypothetical protein